MRTTSSLESLNATLRRSFPMHPHIYKFMDRLKVHEYSKMMDMFEALRSNQPDVQLHRRKKKDQLRDEKIKQLTSQLKSDTNMSPSLFLREMASTGPEEESSKFS